MTEPRADLHLHTRASDGSYEPRELVRLAHELRFTAIAVTDHDSVASLDDASDEGKKLGLRVIPGVELSTIYGDDVETHILGLFIDYRNPELLGLIERAAAERRLRLTRIAELLAKLGIDIPPEDLLTGIEGGSVGRVHMAEALVRRGVTSSIAESFVKYLGLNKPAYVAKWNPGPEECCRVIHAAGGVAVLAHPGETVDEQKLESLVKQGCRAIEAYYPIYSRSVTETYVKLAAKLGVGVSGGSDCHGKRKSRVYIGSVSLPMKYVEDLEKRRGNRG